MFRGFYLPSVHSVSLCAHDTTRININISYFIMLAVKNELSKKKELNHSFPKDDTIVCKSRDQI